MIKNNLKTKNFILTGFIFLFLVTPIFAQNITSAQIIAKAVAEEKLRIDNIKWDKREKWVNQKLSNLDLEQKIAQLFMIAAYSNRNESHYRQIDNFITKYKIGGLIFFQGTPSKQAELTNRYQAKANIPLLIAMDAEWGLGMRLKNTISYPRQMVLGAMNDSLAIYDLGKEVARQCLRLGVHVNFAPVIDVNSNPKNPVIGTRSFGENKYRVAKNGIAYTNGMQDGGIIATAKHFPGHGDTDSDSHYTLPQLKHDKKRLSDVELYPFKRLFADSVLSVMVAHLNVPAYDSTENIPTTLSKNVVTDLLKDELGFDGLIFTDAMNMKGLSSNFTPDEGNVQAILAGNDVLLYPASIPKGIALIKKAVEEGKISEAEIEERVKKVLRAKYFVGLNNFKPIKLKGLDADLNNPQANILNEKLHQKAVTIVRNENNLIPFQKLDTLSFGSVVINEKAGNEFQKMLSNYAPFEHVAISSVSTAAFSAAKSTLSNKKVIIVGVFGVNQYSVSTSFGISAATQKFVKELQDLGKNVVVVDFGHAYSLAKFENQKHLVAAYVDNKIMQKSVPQVLFGAVKTQGRVPVSAGDKIKEGDGFTTKSLGRLRYSDYPEGTGMNSKYLNERIDWLANEAIKYRATPGCQVLIIKDSTVIFQKSYGNFKYDKKQKVENESIYDLASLTKIVATVPAMMQLVSDKKIDLDVPISTYLTELDSSEKGKVTARQLLMHRGGYHGNMPGWFETFSNETNYNKYYSNHCDEEYCEEIAPHLYAKAGLKDSIWNWVIESPMRNKRADGSYSYRYSDRGFYMLNQLVARVSGTSLDYLVENTFYNSLGLSTAYHPLRRYDKSVIVPSSVDNLFRKDEVRGIVHDYSAAILGGVSGHAGTFSNANDIGILMQTFLQGGNYGGVQYFDKEVVEEFTRRQLEGGRRALGFDMSMKGRKIPATIYASENTFGHTGFTGTAAWADADKGIVFIFLANRTYPDETNRKLVTKGIRTRMLEAVFQSVIE
ncbi:beta-glucosidase-like glycosyl hydrolase [Bernardetia litoralis DSM 6794]|uniref:beta-N-acetylhexosaminidase n=1 Tax=Bernardetia litoralis (strain ATCC 23117 / DSM 6794 / NBRC 15988 / NCIMB 1366 / Fx l1 / Sio-4) TaxID=880071 RepID=I4AII1_BERLS|nr:glycoside hydrolase family 3 N-terminal domain-containing protein [Bernardetia litoralis]AFM03766.1 beta-glucosidase-like glycosyl hydrolase [Bernardetia litoralis DSM 6794]